MLQVKSKRNGLFIAIPKWARDSEIVRRLHIKGENENLFDGTAKGEFAHSEERLEAPKVSNTDDTSIL